MLKDDWCGYVDLPIQKNISHTRCTPSQALFLTSPPIFPKHLVQQTTMNGTVHVQVATEITNGAFRSLTSSRLGDIQGCLYIRGTANHFPHFTTLHPPQSSVRFNPKSCSSPYSFEALRGLPFLVGPTPTAGGSISSMDAQPHNSAQRQHTCLVRCASSTQVHQPILKL